MADKCPACGSCGMPMERPEDFALGNPASLYCRYCTDAQGNLLPYEQVLATEIGFYVKSQGITPEAATRLAEALLADKPAWKSRAGQRGA